MAVVYKRGRGHAAQSCSSPARGVRSAAAECPLHRAGRGLLHGNGSSPPMLSQSLQVHIYRGAFGAHVCSIIRRPGHGELSMWVFVASTPQAPFLRIAWIRLRRLVDEASLRFVACSATVANPGEWPGLLTLSSICQEAAFAVSSKCHSTMQACAAPLWPRPKRCGSRCTRCIA